MGAYRLRRHIAAPPDRVFDAFTDPGLVADWMDMDRIEVLKGSLDRPGSRYTMVVRGPWRFRSEVVRAERPTHYEWVGHAPFGTWCRMTAQIGPAHGATELELLTEYRLPFGPLGRWLDRRWIDREPRAVANRELDRLVELVSQGGAQ